MKRGFTLLEMVIAVMLTALLMGAMYGLLNTLRSHYRHYSDGLNNQTATADIYTLLTRDLAQIRAKPQTVHEAGYDRFGFQTDHSIYGIPRPWVYYFISRKERALVRIEAVAPMPFSSAKMDAYPTFFTDVLATECDSLRIGEEYDRFHIFVRCRHIDPILVSIIKGIQ